MSTSFYSEEELASLGLKSYGRNVLISRNTCIYSAENITVGDNVRIDDFTILSGKIFIGNNVHIATFCGLFGGGDGAEIVLEDFAGLSSNVSVYAKSDDYSGNYLTNPTIPSEYKNIISGKVIINKHVIIGAHSVVFPSVAIGVGTAVGAMSLVNKNLDEWSIYAGVPCTRIKARSNRLCELENMIKQKEI